MPILAGSQALGVLAVQSFSEQRAYDLSHQEVLATIAAQAAVAIQNARLYARTDEALARRVQELGSILRTTREGILLLDPEGRVLAANRALADFLGLAQLELLDLALDPADSGAEAPLADLIGYAPADLLADQQALARGEIDVKRQEIELPGPPERYVERTLTPVRDRGGEIAGWLFVFRDQTEEREAARLREELTHMLIHDLRSPLSVLVSGLELMKLELAAGDVEVLGQVVDLAGQSSDRVMRLVDNLLDVNQLESGQMQIMPEAVAVRPLLEKVAARLTPLAVQARHRPSGRGPAGPAVAARRSRVGGPGAAQPGRQCPQVHARRRPGAAVGPARRGAARRPADRRDRHRSWHPGPRPAPAL